MPLRENLTGNTKPSVKFFLTQAAMLTTATVLPAALYLLLVYSLMGSSNPTLFSAAFVLAALIPIGAWIFHFVAVWRAGKKSTRPTVRFLSLIYGPVLILTVFVLIPKFIASSARSYKYKSYQSEAKIQLSAVYAGQKDQAAQHHAYVATFEAAGYRPEPGRASYALALVRCHEGKPSRPDVYLPDNFRSGQAMRAFAETNLRELAGKETCAGRAEGFTAWAAGRIHPEKALDVWRIDEQKNLENIVSGL
jgi:hypothetical protein